MRRLWRRVQRLICPRCIPSEAAPHKPAVAMLERSNRRLDDLLAAMADGDNPVLGERPRAPRRRRI